MTWEDRWAFGIKYRVDPTRGLIVNGAGETMSEEQALQLESELLRAWLKRKPEPQLNDKGVIDFLTGWARELVPA
jgi:hypothetical protein